MKFYNYQRSRSFTDLCPGCLRFGIFLSFSKIVGLIETKLHIEPLWDRGMKVCSWDLGQMIKAAILLMVLNHLNKNCQYPFDRRPHVKSGENCLHSFREGDKNYTILYLYIALGQGQITPRRQNFDCN